MEAYTATERVIPIDLDGNRLALFHGCDAPAPAEIFAGIPAAVRIVCYSRAGELRQTFWRAA